MKRFKKTLATILSFLMCLSLFTNVAHAEEIVPAEPAISEEIEYVSEEEPEIIVLDAETDTVQEDIAEEESSDVALVPTEEETETVEVQEAEAEVVLEETESNEDGSEDCIDEITEIVSANEEDIVCNNAFSEDSETLLENYIDYEIDNNQTPVFYSSTFKGSELTGLNKIIYDKVKIAIAEIAKGERESSIIEFTPEEVGVGGKYSASDLGVSEIVTGGTINPDAVTALKVKEGFYDIDAQLLCDSILTDHPYERYWMGLNFSLSNFEGCSASWENNEYKLFFTGTLKYKISVNKDYAVSGKDYTVDTTKTGAVEASISRINSILNTAKTKNDLEKITYYKDQICALNVYNKEAAAWSNDKYGDPWQLVYVFDGNDATNVVCEGYSKAFKYLCDKTIFSDSSINCYLVDGTMDGGNHMWNIMHWSDNINYLVDVTNCDGGNGNYLFMALHNSGNPDSGYYFTLSYLNVLYIYSSDMKSLYTTEELTIGKKSTAKLSDIFVNYDAYIKSGTLTPFTIIREGGTNSCMFKLNSVKNASGINILGDSYTPSYSVANQFSVVFPEEGKYTLSFSAKDTDNTEITKTISVEAKKASPITNYDELVTALENASTNENTPTEIVLEADINSTSQLTVKKGTYVVLDLNGHIIEYIKSNSSILYVLGNLTIIDSNPDSTHNPSISYDDPTTGNNVQINGGIITGGNGRDGAGIKVYGGKLVLEGGSIAKNIQDGISYSGAGVYVDDGTFIMNGGYICGNRAGNKGGGVYLDNSAYMEINGGYITGNNVNFPNSDGGGIYVSRSTLVINKGEISHNYSGQGGGIGINAASSVTMKDGIITKNRSSNLALGGGGVNVALESTFTMQGGEISANTSDGYGGAVKIEDSNFIMSGNSVIKLNNARDNGGAVYFEGDGVMTMSGNATITQNRTLVGGGGVSIWDNETDKGFFLKGGKITENISYESGGGILIGTFGVLHISGSPEVVRNYFDDEINNVEGAFDLEGALTNGASIGVTSENAPTQGNPQMFVSNYSTYNSKDDPAKFFKSDNSSYAVGANGSGAALFVKSTISFDANGGSGSMSSISDYFGAYDLPECGFTAPLGKRFKAWSISGKEYPVGSTIKVEKDTTIVALWDSIPVYTVTYNVNGGSPLTQTQYSINEGNTYGTMPTTTLTGYDFDGWYTAASGGVKVNSNDTCTGNITLYAHWKASKNTVYKVEHYKEKLEGGYVLADTDTLKGETLTNVTPNVKSYEGFTSPSKKTATIKADGSTVIKYEYTRNSFTLTWNLDGGTATGDYTVGSVKYEASITAPVPTKSGYTFNGWSDSVPAKMPAKDLTLKAKWTANTNTAYKVEHYKQGLDGKYTAKPAVENLKGTTDTSVKPAVKKYDGFKSPSVQTVKIKADGTLVVKYYYTRNSYTLKWDLDGGSASGKYTSGKVKYGTKITAPTPTKKGYTFNGWSSTVSKTMPAKNVTYKAKWKANAFTLTWDLAGGTASNKYTSGKVKAGTKITAPVPEKEGYVFDGWSTSVPSKMPAKNLKITAKWREKTQEEYVTDFVKRFYSVVLERPQAEIDADVDGIKYWVDRLISGVDDGSNVAYGFVYSREFQNKGVSDEEYVLILYHSFFGRDPFDPNNLDTDGYNYWVNKLKAGTDRMDVLAGFTNSAEFQNLCNKYNIKRGTLVPSEKPSYRKAHNLP